MFRCCAVGTGLLVLLIIVTILVLSYVIAKVSIQDFRVLGVPLTIHLFSRALREILSTDISPKTHIKSVNFYRDTSDISNSWSNLGTDRFRKPENVSTIRLAQ